MAEDWFADVRRYDADAPEGVIAGIVRYCGIALQKRDSSLVSFQDPAETGRVRENFLRKKLGLAHTDAELDAAIADVGERMKGDNFKNRVTVYYLLTRLFGQEAVFDSSYTPSSAAGTAALGATAGTGAVGLAALNQDSRVLSEPAVPPPPVHHAPVADATPHHLAERVDDDSEGGLGWLWWLLGLVLLGLLLWWLFARPATDTDAAVNDTVVSETIAPPAENTVDLATAPAEGAVAIPAGAGVTTELRDGKPVVKVYFDTAKTDVAPAFAAAATALKSYLDANAGSSLAISGYNDATGNAASNAELSKNRAQAVQAALVAAGIPQASTELVKPEQTTDAGADSAAARRVEVVVR